MKHIKTTFENYVNDITEGFGFNSDYELYDESYDYGSVEGIIHTDISKITNWFYKRGLDIKDYKQYIKLPIAFLNNINVDESKRSDGHGNQLYDEFENWTIDFDATGIILESDSGELQKDGFNLDNWYIKLGFEKIGTSAGNSIMYKELNNF